MLFKMKRVTSVAAVILSVTLMMTACSSHNDNHGFDPKADPFALVEQAKPVARSQHKLILVMAGGAWCHWCRALDNYIHSDADLNKGFSDTFVAVKVYSGDEKDNKKFFSTLPAAPGVPHFWVLDEHGQLLKSQGTSEFETGTDQYSKQKLLAFVQSWNR
ncbi:MAG: thioredoxin family protein [Steroidobacter sp.]